MMTRKAIQLAVASVAVFVVACGGQTQAAVVEYSITVDVTTPGVLPGTFPDNPWSFSSLPAIFTGTFYADNTVTGPISSLSLVVGGQDLVTSFPGALANSFNPSTLYLAWAAVNAANDQAVGFGAAGNDVSAFQDTRFPPLDPYVPYTLNWAGTYSIAPVPEPSTCLVGALMLLPFGASTLRLLCKRQAA